MTPITHTSAIYENALIKCSFDESGILIAEMSGVERTEENYKILFDLYRKLSDDGAKKICMLCNITRSNSMNKSAREAIITELPKYIKAIALVSDSAVGTMIGNIFITIMPHKFPSKIFTNREDAKNWLKQYM